MGDRRILKKTMWSDLPEHLMERIMELLPVDCFFQFRLVCRRWNSVLSSQYFNSIARNRQPYLILCSCHTQMPSLIYSFFTNTWRRISLSFMPHNCGVSFRGSASGLLLVDIPPCPRFAFNFPTLCVSNPLSKTCIRLPPMDCVRKIMAKAILPVGNNTDEYDIIVVGRSRTDSVIAEVYNSMTRSWKVAGSIPVDPNVDIRNENMFFCKGCLFCMTASGGVMAYRIEDGTTTIVPVPIANANNVWARLVCCKSDVVVVGATEENQSLEGVIMWELSFEEGKDCKWQEIGRMPQSVLDDFRKSSSSNWFECVGVGDKICFRASESMEVLVYDVTTTLWSWLAAFPADLRYMSMRWLPLEPMPSPKFVVPLD